ncbi:NAD(P)H-hydrate dehydratase [Planktotalea sp.]|uniref:NAD(P)H-hydrate dehydratase n=1 Tax=Planktotalea sp. TaxID=2029877 RepID=UPI003D6A559A
MNELLTCAQIRQIEQECIASGSASGVELMERAGRGVVDAIFEAWPELRMAQHRALVLCGPGNNGGDGFVVARLLHQSGWEVDVRLLGDPKSLPRDARSHYKRWIALGNVVPLSDDALDSYVEKHPDTTLVIDALFGAGLSRPFTDLARVQNVLSNWHATSKSSGAPRIVSVDVPSGLCADSGRYLGRSLETSTDLVIKADMTVTFHRLKIGHVLAEGTIGCGTVVVKDIGCIQPRTMEALVRHIHCDQDMKDQLDKAQTGHKYSNGAALVLSGGFGKTGAARLAARAALRIGAGVVTLGVPRDGQSEVAANITALMMTQIEDSNALRAALEDQRLSALCLGPGLGAERAREMMKGALSPRSHLGVVLDADALSAFRAAPEDLFELLHDSCVLTPHLGEFKALFPDIADRLTARALVGPAYSKVDAVRDAAMRAGCTVLLKGTDTVIANQNGICRVHSAHGARSAAWLATAGSGDVLAGFITGLRARGIAPIDAASFAAYLHVECARDIGAGLIAEDLPEALPMVLNRIIKGA